MSNSILQNVRKKAPASVKSPLRKIYNRYKIYKEKRIFCISFQKTGTTSVGDFFDSFGYPTARWKHCLRNHWQVSWYEGDFESIFASKDFKNNQVFEDSPWWFPEFYKVLYHRFPDSKFILFYRDEDEWFRSMLAQSNGLSTNGITKIHAKIYQREDEFYRLVETDPLFNSLKIDPDRKMVIKGMDEHYKSIYTRRNREVIEFFDRNNLDRLFSCNLNDKLKWQKLGEFIGIDVPENFELHSNRTTKKS